eukprot:s5385_g4.t1
MLVGPKAEVHAVATLLGATAFDHLWVLDCSGSLPRLTFVIDGKDYELTGEDLIMERQGNLCLLGGPTTTYRLREGLPTCAPRLNPLGPVSPILRSRQSKLTAHAPSLVSQRLYTYYQNMALSPQ